MDISLGEACDFMNCMIILIEESFKFKCRSQNAIRLLIGQYIVKPINKMNTNTLNLLGLKQNINTHRIYGKGF